MYDCKADREFWRTCTHAQSRHADLNHGRHVVQPSKVAWTELCVQYVTCAMGSTDSGASAGTARKAISSALYRCAVACKACTQQPMTIQTHVQD